MTTPSLSDLIQALDTPDAKTQRAAGDQIVRYGAGAVPVLQEALAAESSHLRKAAAFLLRRVPSEAATLAALEQTLLTDTEPKVRKNAAVTLGKLQATESVHALGTAFRQETYSYVRPSILLALGALGEVARPVLAVLTPETEAEKAAHRKALDHVQLHQHRFTWHTDWAGATVVYLEAPLGLEPASAEEAEVAGLGPVRREGPGLVRCTSGTQPWQAASLRCCYGTLLDAGRASLSASADDLEKRQTVAALLAESHALQTFRHGLEPSDQPIRYRLAVADASLKKGWLRGFKKALLKEVRQVCGPLGWTDSPSNYDVALRVVIEPVQVRLFIKPYVTPDERFAYRVKDVGASINPVIAAGLARMVQTPHGTTVFDPTCGSATLLIERAKLGGADGLHLRGLDVSKTAIRAARTNVKAAGIPDIKINQGNAVEVDHWPACDEVIANLPFGLRTARAEMDLGQLYEALLQNLDLRLRANGQALFYARNKKLFEKTLARYHMFRVHRRGRVLAGGLWIHFWLVRRR